MIHRVEAYCTSCDKSLVRVWAEKPLDLAGVLCLDGDGHKIEIRTESYESIGAMNAEHHHGT